MATSAIPAGACSNALAKRAWATSSSSCVCSRCRCSPIWLATVISRSRSSGSARSFARVKHSITPTVRPRTISGSAIAPRSPAAVAVPRRRNSSACPRLSSQTGSAACSVLPARPWPGRSDSAALARAKLPVTSGSACQ